MLTVADVLTTLASARSDNAPTLVRLYLYVLYRALSYRCVSNNI